MGVFSLLGCQQLFALFQVCSVYIAIVVAVFIPIKCLWVCTTLIYTTHSGKYNGTETQIFSAQECLLHIFFKYEITMCMYLPV